MKQAIPLLLALLPLVACGADGAPERPAAAPGLAISGSATTGVARNGG